LPELRRTDLGAVFRRRLRLRHLRGSQRKSHSAILMKKVAEVIYFAAMVAFICGFLIVAQMLGAMFPGEF